MLLRRVIKLFFTIAIMSFVMITTSCNILSTTNTEIRLKLSKNSVNLFTGETDTITLEDTNYMLYNLEIAEYDNTVALIEYDNQEQLIKIFAVGEGVTYPIIYVYIRKWKEKR